MRCCRQAGSDLLAQEQQAWKAGSGTVPPGTKNSETVARGVCDGENDAGNRGPKQCDCAWKRDLIDLISEEGVSAISPRTYAEKQRRRLGTTGRLEVGQPIRANSGCLAPGPAPPKEIEIRMAGCVPRCAIPRCKPEAFGWRCCTCLAVGI
jgi:hypothetical protein